MNQVLRGWLISVLRLVRFVFWYSIGIAGLFYLLPHVAVFLEGQYESLSGIVRFASVLGYFAVVIGWHVVETRDRWRRQ